MPAALPARRPPCPAVTRPRAPPCPSLPSGLPRTERGPPGAHPLLALLADPDFRGEDTEGQDTETERFLSTSSTGRRVSFNEAALFEQSRKTQDKGRR